ncbi:hypothetical protein ABT282_38555 [Streptomyces sp. NPDC000927]|uniref:hypothetical protein n=1 Tax=Streptomyces sp. NPDC000927 TaxID=3154371 RepID=UPI00332E8EE2
MLLTREQTIEYELPSAEGKHCDPRWPAFADRYGLDSAQPVQWELEALEPDELQRPVLSAVAPYVDSAVLARQIAREEERRRVLATFLGGWDAAGGRGLFYRCTSARRCSGGCRRRAQQYERGASAFLHRAQLRNSWAVSEALMSQERRRRHGVGIGRIAE